MNLQEKILGRFLRYAAVTTQSRPESEVIPSTPGQWELAHMLMEDIAALGVQDVSMDEHAVIACFSCHLRSQCKCVRYRMDFFNSCLS